MRTHARRRRRAMHRAKARRRRASTPRPAGAGRATSTNSALRDPHEWGGRALLRLSFQLLPELVFLQHVGASVRIPKAERLHTDVELGVHEKPFEHAGMEPAYHRRPAADLGE